MYLIYVQLNDSIEQEDSNFDSYQCNQLNNSSRLFSQ